MISFNYSPIKLSGDIAEAYRDIISKNYKFFILNGLNHRAFVEISKYRRPFSFSFILNSIVRKL